MLQKYKYLQILTIANFSLNKQLLEQTLIFINTVPSVSYCSAVMLYAVFNSLGVVYYIKCASQCILFLRYRNKKLSQ